MATRQRARLRWQRSRRAGGGSSAVEADDRGGSNQHPASLNVKTARSWRDIVPFTHLAGEGRMTVTIGRRELLVALGGAAATWPLAARAQQRERMRRIGVLMTRAADDPQSRLQAAAFQQRLQELGWTNDANIRIGYRWGSGDVSKYGKYAAELVALASDVIVAVGGSSVE